MSTQTLMRAGGVALVAQFALCLAGGLLHAVVEGRAHSADALTAAGGPLALTLLFTGTVVLVLATPAAIAHLAPHVGRVGTVAALGHAAALVVVVPHLAVELMVAPVIARDPAAVHLIDPGDSIFDGPLFLATQMIGGLVMMGCLAVLGVTVIRAAGLPSWIGWLMVAALVVLFVPVPTLPVLAGLTIEVPPGVAMAAVGILVLRRTSSARSPEPVAVR